MAKFSVISTFFFAIALSCVTGQQTCLGRCRTVCDDESSPLSVPGNLSRGKKGPKGDAGPPGQKGEKGNSNRHVNSKHASQLERLETIVERQSALIAKQSALLEETSLKVNNQSAVIKEISDVVDKLSSKFNFLTFKSCRAV